MSPSGREVIRTRGPCAGTRTTAIYQGCARPCGVSTCVTSTYLADIGSPGIARANDRGARICLDRLRVIDGEARRFADVLTPVNPATRVPTCPDWDAADLLWHLTEVHLFWAGILRADARTDQPVGAVDAAKPGPPKTVG